MIEKKKRSVVRRKKNKVKTEASKLDSFVPEGEWDVDAASVDMLDLLEPAALAQRKISLSTITAVEAPPSGEEE